MMYERSSRPMTKSSRVQVGVAMTVMFSASARRLGILSASVSVVLSVAYTITLAVALLSLPSPQEPIGDPYLPVLEILIIVTTPLIVAMMVSVHAWASPETKVFSLMALVFMSMLAALTCSLHFVILTVSRQAVFTEQSWLPLFLGWKWPSIGYALDIVAWDVIFPLAVFSAAPVFSGNRLATSIRVLLIVSGVLAVGGLSGVVANDMQLRNIGILGYGVVFPVGTLLLAVLFYRATPASPSYDSAMV